MDYWNDVGPHNDQPNNHNNDNITSQPTIETVHSDQLHHFNHSNLQSDSFLQDTIISPSSSVPNDQRQIHSRDVSVSDSDGPEPATVTRKTLRNAIFDSQGNLIENKRATNDLIHSDYDDEHDDDLVNDSLLAHKAPRGELDDVPDDYELNIDGFRVTAVKRDLDPASQDGEVPSSVISSSVLRSPERQYIKLEVISARQIKGVITFFNILLICSVIYAIVALIFCNTKYKKPVKVPLPATFLSDEQKNRYPPAQAGFLLSGSPTNSTPAPDGSQNSTQSQSQSQTRSNITRTFQSDSKSNVRIFDMFSVNDRSKFAYRQGDTKPMEREKMFDVTVSKANFPRHYVKFVYIVCAILSIFFGLIAILFFIRLIKAGKRNITHEQIWTLLLLIVTAVYFNIIECIEVLQELFSNRPRSGKDNVPMWYLQIEKIVKSSRNTAMITFWFFYIWASLHAYRILDPTKKLEFRNFYLPKLLVIIPYVTFVVFSNFYLNLEFSEIPILSAIAFTYAYGDFQIWNYLRVEWLFSITVSTVELVFILLIVFEARKTIQVLDRAPYMKHRTKRVGFRFFLYINFVFYIVFLFLHTIILLGTPKGDFIFYAFLDKPLADPLWPHTMAPHILLLGYVLATAYVHLPCTSIGVFKGWFTATKRAQSTTTWSFKEKTEHSAVDGDIPAESLGARSIINEKEETKSVGNGSNSGKGIFPGWDRNSKRQATGNWGNSDDRFSSHDDDSELSQAIEPITYRKRESKDSLELKVNCFTMQTHVIMFNFAWYVYYYGTPKLNRFNHKKHPLPFNYEIAAHIRSETTDTQVLIVDCTDRIIVTFKGTTSLRNLRTSIRVDHERLQEVIRTSIYGEDESHRLKKLFGHRYLKGKIHKGFAEAYLSVAEEVMGQVASLREVKLRPVFLTGHSLGGALATICSLDMWVKLDINRREIFVSTFGSPRVGNDEFARLYDEVIPLHWRIVVDPDMIAKLPSVGYSHVGKKVVLTPLGEMIIDPSALEKRPWSGESAVFAYHRKASYMLAMRAWCLQNHAYTYTPAFWPFPIRRDDERRFADAFVVDDGSFKKSRNPATKIVRMDALVDALGDDADLGNLAVVERWARLSNRILLHDSLAKRIRPAESIDDI